MSQICHINLFSGDNWQKVDIWPLFQTQWKETGHHKQGIKENFRKQLREVISTDEWCFYANYPFLPCPPPASTDTRVFLLDAKNFICAYEGIEYWWFKWWLWWRWSSQMLQKKHIFWDGSYPSLRSNQFWAGLLIFFCLFTWAANLASAARFLATKAAPLVALAIWIRASRAFWARNFVITQQCFGAKIVFSFPH